MNVKDPDPASSRYRALRVLLEYLDIALFLGLLIPSPWRDSRLAGLLLITSGGILLLRAREIAAAEEGGPNRTVIALVASGVLAIVAGIAVVVLDPFKDAIR